MQKDFIEYGANYSDVDLEQEGYIHRIVHPDILEAERKENMDVEGIKN